MHSPLDSFFEFEGIPAEDIPKIPLYMDQLLGLFENSFSELQRNPEDKIMTKTMVNNYVKAKVIPPPHKKKYSREQMMLLILVYQLKSILPIGDIKALFKLFETDDLSDSERNERIEAYYNSYAQLQKNHLDILKTRYEAFTQAHEDPTDNKALAAQLLVEAELNRRLALILMDESSK